MGKNVVILFLTFLSFIIFCQFLGNTSTSDIFTVTENLADFSGPVEDECQEDNLVGNIRSLVNILFTDDTSGMLFSGNVLGISLSIWQPPE
jgi:hypothetical protein